MIKFKTTALATGAAYAKAYQRLAQLPGFKPRDVLRAEAGVILKQWAGRTKVGTIEKADRRSRLRAIRGLGLTQAESRGDVTVNAGYRAAPFGRVWIRARNGGGRKAFLLAKGPDFSNPSGPGAFPNANAIRGKGSVGWLGNVQDAVLDVNAAVNRALAMGRKSIALARQSVVQIADALGIDLLRVSGGGISAAGISKARGAMSSTGVFYKNGTGRQGGDDVACYVDLVNRLPYGVKIGMDRVLTGVIAGRAKYIEKSYAKGAFDSTAAVARAFPNLFKVRSN